MSEKIEVKYDVVVKGNSLAFYLDFEHKFDTDILPNLTGADFSGVVDIKSEVIDAIEKTICDKLPIILNGKDDNSNDNSKSNKNSEVSKPVPSDSEVNTATEPVVDVSPKTNTKVNNHTNQSVEIPPIPEDDNLFTGYRKSDETAGSTKNSQPAAPKEAAKREDGIKDVQMLAINTQLDLNKANYKELVKEAFEEAGIEVDEIPTIDNLTYKQAIEVIKYGNKKFKR
jgi:hypothetical protein